MTRALGSRWLRTAAAVTWWCAATWLAGPAAACDTPVYRYAMYRWQPAPYELYCFYDTQPDAESEAVMLAVERRCADEAAPANLLFVPVDLQKDQQLTGVPPDIKEAWDRQSSKHTPWYLISSPVGVHLFEGRISEGDVAALVDSPARHAVGQLLEQGKAGVYVLVTTDNQLETERAEKEIRGVLDDVAAGKVALYTTPGQSAEEGVPATPPLEFGLIQIARTDATEKWLLDCLLATEPDLRSATEPLAFLIYGRGRALFSSLGKGIHRDNLIQDVEFITGACSCTVKEQNPGVDLLMSYNWDAVAEALLQRFGREEGSPYRFGGDSLFPELIIPPEQTATPAVSVAADSAAVAEATTPASANSSEAAAAPPITPSTTELVPAEASPSPATATEQLAVNALAAPAAEALASNSANPWRPVLWVGGGLAGALLVLFGATWLVLRPR